MLTGAIIGMVVALTMMGINRRRAKRGSGLPGTIEQTLGTSGPLTLKQIAALVGKDSFMGRGEVAQALGALTSIGKVRMNPAPAGTPQLEKVNVVTYERIEKPTG